ncbi:uncharacterized protein PHACADRAFT_208262 [Phanerochaete carnosa HHB-10118-sp]|uniref:Uncharacterized protein n=1 Tax=Phanerochaete carnosa (strain HHB-10118-sp) TaxID=650164 RepID=K5WDK9_PHACS|nr:uncharacterized protein PHACADRAFT_208262 [Phanerochaete carnosa HHB-10118-sp]EKM57119.1 hypothetical protein PHACADRAFT_208262 [Phanerochaete carnosa HHB-10118-sp]
MDEKRAKTLDALSTFIKSQKALLARTQSDIERLTHLRQDIASTPAESRSFSIFSEQLQTLEGLRLSDEQDNIVPGIHRELDWASFASSDPVPIRTLGSELKNTCEQWRRPSAKQTSPLSALQILVKTARITMVDPILASLPELSEGEEDEPIDPEELRRIQERKKIHELKRRRIHGDPAMHGLSGLALRRPGNEAVFVRQDQQDESAEVDIGLDDDGKDTNKSASNTTPSSAVEPDMDVDTPATSVASPQSTHSGKALPVGKTLAAFQATASSCSRCVPTKASANRASTKNSTAKTCFSPPVDNSSETEAPIPERKTKPRSETYKQAWSVEEQHLLERLLEEIPDGEKNRWLKISQAMNGRRTARQVASRVQKYYEKLKRFGVDISVGSTRSNNS